MKGEQQYGKVKRNVDFISETNDKSEMYPRMASVSLIISCTDAERENQAEI